MSGDRHVPSVSFTQQLCAELALYPPQRACCRTSMLLGLRLVSDDSDTVTTTRLVAARAAVQLAHAQGQPAHVVRIAVARRCRYALWGLDVASLPAATDDTHCLRALVRGVVLASGRLVRPDVAPHLEVSCPGPQIAAVIADTMRRCGISSRLHEHRGMHLVTVRSTADVGALLSTIGAQTTRLQFEAGCVVREMRAGVNRRLNAETANLRRLAAANLRQLEVARRVTADVAAWQRLPPALREAARLRIEHPDDDLASLARRAGCSRPAMGGRLQRLLLAASAHVAVVP
jgi:WhiA LAGLIDADG-like domain/WhiA C-terminal HTH domain